jgi:hypothetical protein
MSIPLSCESSGVQLSSKIPLACEAGLIHHRAIEHGRLQQRHTPSHGRIAHIHVIKAHHRGTSSTHVARAGQGQPGKSIPIAVFLGHLRSGFAARQCIGRMLPLFIVKFQLEPDPRADSVD